MRRSQTVQEALDLNSEVQMLCLILAGHPKCCARDSTLEAFMTPACASLATHEDLYGNAICETHSRIFDPGQRIEMPQARLVRRLTSILTGEP